MDAELRAAVIERDARAIWEAAGVNQGYPTWRRLHPVICIVPLLDPDNIQDCGGAQTVDHVHGQPPVGTMSKTDEGGFGKRAPDDAEHLVAMCENHNVWNPPSKRLRRLEREYLGITQESFRTGSDLASATAPVVVQVDEDILTVAEDAEAASDRAPVQETGDLEQQES